MRILSSPLVSLLLLTLIPLICQAASPLDVVVNEIAWMGTKISYNDEWIELYNNSDSPINLEGWILKAADGTPKINLTGVIAASSFYLLERTDDNTVVEITADQIYAGALGNNGENLELYDISSNLIDSLNCSSGWLAGDNLTKQTMERKTGVSPGSDPGNWQTSQDPGGTPKAKNSIVQQIEQKPPEKPEAESEPKLISQEESKPSEETVEVKPQQLTYPSGIVINEILPSPAGPDEKEEWIEIFNQNNFEVDLSGWQIADTVGKTFTYTLPAGTKISTQGFLVLSRPTTKITLNNDEDGLNLIQPDGKIIGSVTYGKAARGQSYNRINSDWAWSATLTPGSANIIPAPQLSRQEPKEEKSETGSLLESKKELAAIGEQFSKSPKSLYVFLIAFGLAIFSGIIILILKRKLKTSYNKNV